MRNKADNYTDGMAELGKIFADRDRFTSECIPLLKKYFVQQHSSFADCDASFQKYIVKLCKYTAIPLWEKMADIDDCTKKNITPGNCSYINFERQKKYLAYHCTPPETVTSEKYKTEIAFNHAGNKQQQKWIDEENSGKYKRWKRQEDYVAAFINTVQELLFTRLPGLLNMESEWWMVYKYYQYDAALFSKFRAERIEKVIKCGLTAEWLDKPWRERKKKINEGYEKGVG